jgi:hypothetical protein
VVVGDGVPGTRWPGLVVCAQSLARTRGGRNTTGLAYQIKAVVKHRTEVAGWLLIALGLFRLGLPRRGHPDAV